MKIIINIAKISKIAIQTLIVATLFVTNVIAENHNIATLRASTSIDTQATPSPIANVINKDIKQARNYPMQPPVIPHKTRNYEVNLNSNKCMSCHSRSRTEESQAPMVSVTHFMDRDGNFLAEISPRRYFCNQCHATQTDAKLLVENDFVDMHTLMKAKRAAKD
ncbi:nitrate reductase cytochrome c-type subunit [Thalassotalea profundi]|uniref:Periplasmic nitrate reductase, electron transfer subunit n=1 Tax=Thalassotalea profundi TaxID=2036687 RepID=A0ABQ3IKI6_9GAMM|nr:nitrate reductase cytochrome c-type subunit [Thalassotalea profundi]GHE87199.1 periplasmic nitrate reductase, electron transfer subunit [Thalassotalea profundi]